VNVSKKIGANIELNLTLDDKAFRKSFYFLNKKPKNFKIINHGIVPYSKIRKLYRFSEFLIFPSLNESFGLPLIESIFYECKVLASNLSYVDEVIKPSLRFNPNSISSISDSIQHAIRNNLKKSEIIVENKIDTFVKYIS
tara:strand:- start:343 stop:762 length:420 start_codon:yes stop_codon:yes gene_type:complete